PGRPSGGKHVAVVLSTDRFHAATGRALVAGLVHPKDHRQYPSHVLVLREAFAPVGAGRPLPEDRVVQLDQARTVPAPARALRIGALAGGLWDGRACRDDYGLEAAFHVHFQIEGYLERRARHGRPMRPVEVPGSRYPRGSVWRADGGGDRRLVLVSNETYNEISDFVQGLEVAATASPGSVAIRVQAADAGTRPESGHLLPVLRSVGKAGLRPAGRLGTSDLGALDRCLLDMIGE
ncbi:MAG TPA: type II toxin-antitoxin system PemK/MazF family toxin, partial [Candidatus Methylomirabilis sp.]